MSTTKIPTTTLEALMRYTQHGIRCGSFLHHVLCNDLMGACKRADPENAAALHDIVMWIDCFAPFGSYGSVENVHEFMDHMKNLHERQLKLVK